MLLEREAESTVLEHAFARLPDGGGRVLLVRGEAGIGKSSLVQAFIDRHQADAHVFAGACDDLFIPQALGPFWDIARTEEAVREAVHNADRPQLMDRLVGLLERRDRPTIMVVEDTQWADEATLDSLRYLGRRIGPTNGLLLLTYRDSELDQEHPLRRVIGDIPVGNIVRVQLGGLSLPSVASMLGDSRMDPASVLAQTKGNPLLVSEIAASSGDTIPGSLQDAIAGQLQRMSIGAQEAVRTLSVIPEPIPLSDALRLTGVDSERLDEAVQRGLLELSDADVTFHHDLVRRAIESSMSDAQRKAKFRAVLRDLPDATHPCLIIDCAVEVGDVDRLLVVAPRSARYAAAAGSHLQAAEDFRVLDPYLDRLDRAELGPLLEQWAFEEFQVDDVPAAIRVAELALEHYRALGDRRGVSRVLTKLVRYLEAAGERERAESAAREAVAILGDDPDGSDLAKALEAAAFLRAMSGDADEVSDLVDRMFQAGGESLDAETRVRALIHEAAVVVHADVEAGIALLDDARQRAAAAGLAFEEWRATLNAASGLAEARLLDRAQEAARTAVALAERHELLSQLGYSQAILARVLDLRAEWDAAADLARPLVDGGGTDQIIPLPVIGAIEARRGIRSAAEVLAAGWELSRVTGEFRRMGPAAVACAEYAWISGERIVPPDDLRRVLEDGLRQGSSWTTGMIAFWLWLLDESDEAPAGIAEPCRRSLEGDATGAAAMWAERGMPYEQALASIRGDDAARIEAVERFETLGATATASRLRKLLRDAGLSVPRGRSRQTRRHAAGLTARQAEVLDLLSEGLTNLEIADRLFVSPRTVEHHVTAILDKLDASTREEAVDHAEAAGLLTNSG